MIERRVYCPDCGSQFSVSIGYACPYCGEEFRHSEGLREHIEDHIRKPGKWEH